MKKNKLLSGFFYFFIKNYKVSFLLLFLIVITGIYSLISIPKESSPDIKFGIISIGTPYIGVNPEDIDKLITEKIEDKVLKIDGIKKVTSSSTLGFSSVVAELDNGANTRDIMSDIRTDVDSIILPNDTEDTTITEISTDSELVFNLNIFGKVSEFTQSSFLEKIQSLVNKLEKSNYIDTVGVSDLDYNIEVLLDKETIKSLNITVNDVVTRIKEINKNTPVGNYIIGDKKYDFRFDSELVNKEELLEIPILYKESSIIKLKDIAIVRKEYISTAKNYGFFDEIKNDPELYFSKTISINKSSNIDIFKASKESKALISNLFRTSDFAGLKFSYAKDMGDVIKDDYKGLSKNAIQTIILIFLTLFVFMGIREALLAGFLLPVAFMITFSVLYFSGLTLNFLTNFSLILTLGIAIDTILVIIEGAHERVKQGLNTDNAIILAISEFKAPLISGTLTTLLAFLPMMFLPGIMGKFLSFIPITIFATLLATLILSLTLNSAIFMKIGAPSLRNKLNYKNSKNIKNNINNSKNGLYKYTKAINENKLPKHIKLLLKNDRIGKKEKVFKKNKKNKKSSKININKLRIRFQEFISNLYIKILKIVLKNTITKIIAIFLPVVLLILTFIFISPKLGFVLMPQSDNPYITIEIKAPNGTISEVLEKNIPKIRDILKTFPEIYSATIRLKNNKITGSIELYKENFRKDNNLLDSATFVKKLEKKLNIFNKGNIEFQVVQQTKGPPTGSAVGIKLAVDDVRSFSELFNVSKDFKEFLLTINGTKAVSLSSESTPGQFIFKFNHDLLALYGLTESQVLNQISSLINGQDAGKIKGLGDDYSIKVKLIDYRDNLSPSDIENLEINTNKGLFRVGDVVTVSFDKAVQKITREDGDIIISLGSEVQDGYLPTDIQPKLDEFANNYNFPKGVYFIEGGESANNADLIKSTIFSFFIAIFSIFMILVFQFNSYSQPAIILYSVVLALLGVNIGLYALGQPYSMPFAIGFISLTGIVINDAIILIDRINVLVDMGIDKYEAVIDAGKQRLQPIIITTLTTVFGIIPISMQDNFWLGLGGTIIFGLSVGSAMTITVIPALYLLDIGKVFKKGFRYTKRKIKNIL